MPFQSKAQQGYLFANNPAVAKKMAAKTTPAQFKNLPKHKKKALQNAAKMKLAERARVQSKKK